MDIINQDDKKVENHTKTPKAEDNTSTIVNVSESITPSSEVQHDKIIDPQLGSVMKDASSENINTETKEDANVSNKSVNSGASNTHVVNRTESISAPSQSLLEKFTGSNQDQSAKNEKLTESDQDQPAKNEKLTESDQDQPAKKSALIQNSEVKITGSDQADRPTREDNGNLVDMGRIPLHTDGGLKNEDKSSGTLQSEVVDKATVLVSSSSAVAPSIEHTGETTSKHNNTAIPNNENEAKPKVTDKLEANAPNQTTNSTKIPNNENGPEAQIANKLETNAPIQITNSIEQPKVIIASVKYDDKILETNTTCGLANTNDQNSNIEQSSENDTITETCSSVEIYEAVKTKATPTSNIVTDKQVPVSSQIKTTTGKNASTPSESKSADLADTLNSLLPGDLELDNIPALPHKVVRVFISSTFTDTKEERNALMEHVYPKLADYCKEAHGLELQIVDMRWGVPEEASDQHSTTDLCLQEIRKCQETSVGPTFVAIVGDKYGYRPVPSRISSSLFDILAGESSETDWSVVQRCYLKDENAIPSCHVLQPVSALIPSCASEDSDERRSGWQDWWQLNQQLTATLRAAADKAQSKQLITEQDKHAFYMSVTENEITHGILKNASDSTCDSAYCIVRQIPDVTEHLSNAKAGRFVDMRAGGELDNEAQRHLQRLRDNTLSSVLATQQRATFNLPWDASGANITSDIVQDVTSLVSKEHLFQHRQYLDNVCSSFNQAIRKMIQRGALAQENKYDELSLEILQHMHLARQRCSVFEGRNDILDKINVYLKSPEISGPLVVHGSSGCGKTSVMAKTIENIMRNENQHVMIARFLGTSTNSCNLHQLLVSLCRQICCVSGQTWKEPETTDKLIAFFQDIVKSQCEKHPFMLILDSIDQLLPAYNAYKLKWLPDITSPNMKIIISTIDEGYPILGNVTKRYEKIGIQKIQVEPLGESLGLQVINKWLEATNRKSTTAQSDIIKKALSVCSLPLYARITFDQIVKWRSFDTPSVNDLGNSVQGAITKLFEDVEAKFGATVVRHCLAYVTASRNGLSEPELEHVLSLDDTLLNTVFSLWRPPIRRIPPLIWTRIRNEINNYIVERSADDSIVLFWYHRQFIQTAKARYLSEKDFELYIHQNLVDFFSGKWGSGVEKPFRYTDAQVKRFSLEKSECAADRKVPAQPLSTQLHHHGNITFRYNKRAMAELPYHLVKSKNHSYLLQNLFFSFEWLFSKISSSSVHQLLEEFEVFMQSDKVLQSDVEMKLLYANLQLIRPDLERYPRSLSFELQGRLSKFVGRYDIITNLIKQCDQAAYEYCPLVPLTSCFKTAELGFTQNIHFRRQDPLFPGGASVCTANFSTIHIIDYDLKGKPVLLTYDIQSGEKIDQKHITKPQESQNGNTTDIYFNIGLMLSGKQLFAFYKIKDNASYSNELQKGNGFLDIIEIDTARVIHTHECFLYRDEFFSPLMYRTNAHLCYSNGWKMPLLNTDTNELQNLNRVTYLSEDERFFILCNKDKTFIKAYETNDLLGEFDLPESQVAVTASRDFNVIAMVGSESNNISIFDLSNKRMKTKKKLYQLLKPKHIFKLERQVTDQMKRAFESITNVDEKGNTEEVTNNRILLKISPSGHHLLVNFIGWKWTAFMWRLNIGRHSAKFVGCISDGVMDISCQLPQFSHDGACVIYNTSPRRVVARSCDDASILTEYSLQENIRDICVSTSNNKLAVLLQKNLVILTANTAEETTKGPKVKKSDVDKSAMEVLCEREIGWNGEVKPEVTCWRGNVEQGVTIEEVQDVALSADTDRIATARSHRRHAIVTYVTPDGTRTLHLHAASQLIDTVTDEIVYTPRKGDRLVRTQVDVGVATNIDIPIPGVQDTSSVVLDLMQGDRIMNETNKIKYRVNQKTTGQFKIMKVPSLLTVYTAEETKLTKTARIDSYKQSVILVSNEYVVANKHTKLGHFVNIYGLADGRLLASHRTTAQCDRGAMIDSRLVLVDRRLNVRLLNAPQFLVIEKQIDVGGGSQASHVFTIKAIVTFQNPDSILIHYCTEGAVAQNKYMYVDLTSGETSKEMTLSSQFEDVTPDGAFGIDAQLNVYDLPKGVISRKIPFTRDSYQIDIQHVQGEGHSDLSVRFCCGKKLICIMDRQATTLHLTKFQDKTSRSNVSCQSHVPNLSYAGGFSLRNSGTVVLLNGGEKLHAFGILASKSSDSIDYTSEQSRVISLIATLTRQGANVSKTKQSMYERRRIFLSHFDKANEQSTKAKPSLLVLGDPFIVSNVFNNKFSDKIDTYKTPCSTMVEASTVLNEENGKYDAIILQIGGDDVVKCEVEQAVVAIKDCAKRATNRTSFVVISEGLVRSDSKELNEKILQLNEQLHSIAADNPKLKICVNSNLGTNGKPNSKFYQDGVFLSSAGIMRLTANFKAMLAPHFKLHHI